jgi:hypothetical protein
VRFFLDNNISPHYAAGLRAFAKQQHYDIVHLSEKFEDRSIADPDWIRALAKEGDWAIVSADQRIMKGRAEQAAWRESGLTSFFFGSGWTRQSYWEQAADIVKWWPKIVLAAREAAVGTAHVMPLHGKDFKILYTPR